jgi:hypothetical protein
MFLEKILKNAGGLQPKYLRNILRSNSESQSNDAGFAYFHLHESQKVGNLEVERHQIQAKSCFLIPLFSQFNLLFAQFNRQKRRLSLKSSGALSTI